jgi:hypothetical protein
MSDPDNVCLYPHGKVTIQWSLTMLLEVNRTIFGGNCFVSLPSDGHWQSLCLYGVIICISTHTSTHTYSYLTIHVTFQIINLEWWPLTRDCSIYIVTIGVLTAVTLDEKVEWYEALILVLMYITYFLIMWSNRHLMKLAKKLKVKIIGSKTVLNDPGKLVLY